MSGVGNRTLSGRELHDHIIDIDTDDSTQVYVDSSCKGDTVEEKHKLAESSCSNVDKKYIAAQVDEVPNLFGENLVQTDSSSQTLFKSHASIATSLEERQSRFGNTISTYKPSKKDTDFSSRYNHAKEKRLKRAERADRKYISIKIEGDKNDYSIEEILEKLGEADKDKKRAKVKDLDEEEPVEDFSESAALIEFEEVERTKDKRKGKPRDRKLRRSKEDKLVETKKKSFSSEPEDDDSGGSLAGDGPVLATFSSTVEFNHIKTNVALVDSSPLDLRRQFSRSTENLSSFTEVTKKPKRKKKSFEDSNSSVIRSVRAITPQKSKNFNQFGTPVENLNSQDSNSVLSDRMSLSRAWKKATLVQSRSVDGGIIRRGATNITAPIQSKSQPEDKELDLATDFPPLPDVSQNDDSHKVGGNIWPHPKPMASDSHSIVIETKSERNRNNLRTVPPDNFVQTTELPNSQAVKAAIPEVMVKDDTLASFCDELFSATSLEFSSEKLPMQPSPGLIVDCDAFTQADHIWQVCDVSNEIIEKSIVESRENSTSVRENGDETKVLSYNIMSDVSKKWAQEQEKSELKDQAGESFVMNCKGKVKNGRPILPETTPTYMQIVSNGLEKRHFDPTESFQDTLAKQQRIGNTVALKATSESSTLPNGNTSEAVVFCKELDGSSWSTPTNVVFGFNIDQELLSASNCGTSPIEETQSSENSKPRALNEEDNAILGYGANLDDLRIPKVSSDDSGIINSDLSPESGICIDQQIHNFFPLNQTRPEKLGSSDSGASSWADPDDPMEDSKSATDPTNSPLQFDVKFNYSEIVVFLRDSWIQIQNKLKTPDPLSIRYYDDTICC